KIIATKETPALKKLFKKLWSTNYK
ncbi:uncharacterized protein METZ01_LOCUS516739, partial [marine metagenome]